MTQVIPERTILATVKAEGWTLIDPRGRKTPRPFARGVNGSAPCESYGHFKKGDKLVAVFSSDRRNMGQTVMVRTIEHPADFTGGINRLVTSTEDIIKQLRSIEAGA